MYPSNLTPAAVILSLALSSAFPQLSSAQTSNPVSTPTVATNTSVTNTKILGKVRERYKLLKNWKAKFQQETLSIGLGKNTFSEGEFAFGQPNRIFFSIVSPASQAMDFVSNGTKAWQIAYRNGRNQAPTEVQEFNASSLEVERYLVFLGGLGKQSSQEVQKNFNVNSGETPKGFWISLQLKVVSDLASIKISFEGSSLAPALIEVEDSLSTLTKIRIIESSALDAKTASTIFQPKNIRATTGKGN